MPVRSIHAEHYPAIIIGAGQAGVALSYCLQQRGVAHLILEGDRPFADWYRRRWDSFAMNTPNWMNRLPGERQPFAPHADRNAYGKLCDAIEYFQAYLASVAPPVRIEKVESVGENRDGTWHVVSENTSYNTDNLAICTGHASRKRIPAVASCLPESILQLHSSEYQNPAQIDSCDVLVVGSGSSGVQISHELATSGRFDNIHLAESGNFTLPWRVLGVSTYSLMRAIGAFKITRGSWIGRMMFPRLARKGDPATPPSPRHLARTLGVHRVGRVESVDRHEIHCSDGQAVSTDGLAIIWCTGFDATYDFLDVYVRDGVLDRDGVPTHQRGVATSADGLFFVGLRFQHTFISQDIGGVGNDAEYIADQIAERVKPADHDTQTSSSATGAMH